MKTKIFRISKQTLSIVLALMMIISTMLVGMVTVDAGIDNGGYVYFVKPSSWSCVQFFVGHGSYSQGYNMTEVTNTDNLYYVQVSNWGDATEFAFFETNGWGAEGNSIAHRAEYAAHNTEIKSGFSLKTGEIYIITPASGDDKTTISINSFGSGKKSYTYLNSTQTLKVATSTDGTAYTTPSSSPATISASSYKFGSYSSCSSSTTATLSGDTTSTTVSSGYLASTTLSVTDIDSGYTFDGWYNGSTKVSDAVTYTYYPTAATTLTARFTQSAVDSQLTSTVSTGGTVTYSIGDSSITPPCTVTSGNTVTVNAEPDDGYELDSIKVNGNELETGVNTFVMPKEDTSVEVTFVISNPTVSITPSSATVAIGQSITLAPEATHALGCTGVYTVEKDSTSLDAENYIVNNEFRTPMTADAAGVYTITYTATVNDSDVTGSAVSTITVSPSAEQQNYALLAAWLSDATKTPEYLASLNKYTTASLEAYEKVYTAADDVDDTYPVWNATENTTAYNNLAAAYEDLTELISLDKPVLNAVPECVDVTSGSKTVELSVNTSYPTEANVEYEFYVSGNSTPIYTGSNNSYEVTLDSAGTYSYYVKIVNGNEDEYYCNDDTSTAIEVEAVTTVTVSVEAGENGTAYISKYYQYDGAEVTSNVTSNTTVQIKPGTSVTFTAVPASGFAVENWNGSESEGSTTYTKSDITSAYTASVTFVEESEIYFYVASANSWGTSHPWVTLADKSQGTLEKVEKIISNGYLYNSSTKVQSYTFDVYLFKVTKNTPIIVGNNDDSTYGNWSMYIEEPVSGACYYYGNTTDTTYNEGTINPMTLTSVTATSTNYVKDNKVTFSVEAASHNGKTAGQDDYTVTYTVCDASGTQISTGDSFTPTTAGQYTVKATAVDNTSGKIQTNTVSKTFTIYDTLPQFKVFYGSNNSTMGSVSTNPEFNSGSSVDMGTTVTLTATPNSNYTFKTWEITGEYTSSGALTDTELTITVNGNITAIATFQEDLGTKKDNYTVFYRTSSGEFKDASKSDAIVYESSSKSGVYKASLSPSNLGVTSFKDNYYMAISSSTKYEDSFGLSEELGWFTVTTETPDFVTLNAGNYDNLAGIQNYSGMNYVSFSLSKAALTESILIQYDSNTQTYTVNAYSNIPEGVVEVFAKDGTIRKDGSVNYQKYSEMADSTFSDAKELLKVKTDANEREEAYAAPGATFTITTTIEDTYRDKYYVKAFCVNGISYAIIENSQADTTDGTYSFTYTVPYDYTGSKIEITPIYFYIINDNDDNETNDSDDFVTFYVENFNDTVQADWGDTIACHAYYTGGNEKADFNAADKNALGGYPGQPMVNQGGKLYMQIPKILNGDADKPVKGITLNNFYWDDIHTAENNYQTYDYDDFVRIANLGTADNIIFSFKYKTKDNITSTTPTDDNLDSFKNGWENLTDYYGRRVDLFGNILSDTEINSKTPLRIVSNGYATGDNSDSDYVGKYSTNWHIYALKDGSWEKIGYLPPSALLFSNATALSETGASDDYVSAYNALQGYANTPAIITYEGSIWGDNEDAFRADGRWYYSKTGDKVTTDIIIEYADDASSEFVVDEFKDGNVGTITGASAYFANSEFYGQTTATTLLDTSKYFNLTTIENTTTGYMFYGWYLKKTDGTYSLISTKPDYDAPISGTETFVARYIKIPSGDLVISHNLYSTIKDKLSEYTGDDIPNTGLGNCYLKVEILNADGTTYLTFGSETSKESVHLTSSLINAKSDKSVRIYIYTDPLGNDNFLKYYVNNHNPEPTERYCRAMEDFTTKEDGTAYLQLPDFSIKDFFNAAGENTVPSLEFYSDIESVAKNYTITYNYESRKDGSKKYVVKGTFDANYIEQYGNADLTLDIVKQKAPFVDDFGKKITWVLDEDNVNIVNGETEATATVNSTKDEHIVSLTLKNADGSTEVPVQFLFGMSATYGNIKSGMTTPGDKASTDYIYVADDCNADDEKFSYWEVCNTNGELVTKCYSQEFNYILYGNYIIQAKYGVDDLDNIRKNDISSTIDLLEYTRNQWTDDNGVKTGDYLYADFDLAYNYNNKIIETLGEEKVKVGIAFEVCGKLVEESNGTYDTTDIEDKYKDKYAVNESALKEAIKQGSKTYSVDENTSRNLYNYQITNEGLSNKNRVEYYLRFKNSPNNQLYVMKVYSYIIDVNTGDVYLSDPVYMNLYDIANCVYNIS